MRTRDALIALAAVCGVVLAACSEEPQRVRYEGGKYDGKADTRPWEGPVFNGDKAAWERAVAERTRSQNEYVRVQ